MSSDSPTRSRIKLSSTLSNLSLAAATFVFSLGVAELLLRSVVPPSRTYATLPPGADWTLVSARELFHGVVGTSHVRVNQFGVRGRPFDETRAEYRILAVGASTTFCRALDDTEVWTHLLEADLGRTPDGRAVWVGNVGRDGTRSRDHVLHLKYLLPQYPHMDVVVSLVGANDMLSALEQGWEYRTPAPLTDPGAEREQLPRAFARLPGRMQDLVISATGPEPWYKATALWQVARRAYAVWTTHRTITLGVAGRDPLQHARLARARAPKIDSLPPLAAQLTEYRQNLNAMADLAAAAGVQLVFVTQPSAWREDMSPAEQGELWLGFHAAARAPGPSYFTTRVLGHAMARYNETLLDVCRERGLDCVDAARLLPHDTTAMYDDVHFNEQGSRMLARVLVEHFRARPPFRRPA